MSENGRLLCNSHVCCNAEHHACRCMVDLEVVPWLEIDRKLKSVNQYGVPLSDRLSSGGGSCLIDWLDRR